MPFRKRHSILYVREVRSASVGRKEFIYPTTLSDSSFQSTLRIRVLQDNQASFKEVRLPSSILSAATLHTTSDYLCYLMSWK